MTSKRSDEKEKNMLTVKLNTIDKVKTFCSLAEKCEGNIDVSSGRYVVDGKSIMGLFSIDLSKELTVNVTNEEDLPAFESALKSAGLI